MKNTQLAQFCAYFQGKSCVLILGKNGLGYILGDFLTNPACNVDIQITDRQNVEKMTKNVDFI
jgi:hypothetical protein